MTKSAIVEDAVFVAILPTSPLGIERSSSMTDLLQAYGMYKASVSAT